MLRHYATSQNIARSKCDEVIAILQLPNPSNHSMVLGFYSAPKRNEYQEIFLGSRTLPTVKADGSHRHFFAEFGKNIWELQHLTTL
jgi:hypothetical protein